jgi:phage host-nuclease inhibitor protein Gam
MSTETLEQTDAVAREEYDGRLITDDGEVIETPAEFLPVIRDETPPDEGFVKWVLRKYAEAQAQAVAAEAVVESADAVVVDLQNAAVAKLNENPEYVEAMARRDHAQRCAVKSYAMLKRLQFYTPMLQRFAEIVTAGKKSRTWDSPHGSIKLRSKPGRLKIRDEAAAVAFARKFGIDGAVKVTETFQVSQLPDDWKKTINDQLVKVDGDELGITAIFERTPDETSVEVVTGVKVKA